MPLWPPAGITLSISVTSFFVAYLISYTTLLPQTYDPSVPLLIGGPPPS